MKLEQLPISKEKKNRKRVGRGPGSGTGKTATRGEKGQKSRSGGKIAAWFEGGQSPLYRRLPKRGFRNTRFAVKYEIVNLAQLEHSFDSEATVTPETLKAKGIIKKSNSRVKILAQGTLTKKLIVKAHRFSTAAITKIEAIGGGIEVL